jgi:iron complex transport system substrate-binding protein
VRPIRSLLVLSVLAAALAGCASSDATHEPDAAGADGAVTTTVDAPDTSRLVVLNGDLTEIVFALGLGDRVVATDTSATYPPEATRLPKIGYQRSLNAEGIIAQRPTLVLASTDAGPPPVLDQLRSAGVAVRIIDEHHDLNAAAEKIRAVGRALGASDRAESLAAELQRRLDAVASAGASVTPKPRIAVLFLRGANTQLLFGDDQGIETIATTVGAVAAVSAKSTIPLTPEALVAAQPDVLVVTTGGLESVGGIDGILRIPGVAETPAGRARRVFAYEDQMLLGFGPRFAECMEQLFTDLHERKSQ